MRGRSRKYDPAISAIPAARYLAVDFVELVERLEEIEQGLSNDAYLELLRLLETSGAEVRGDVFAYRGKYFQPIVYIDWATRSLNVNVRSVAADSVKSVEQEHIISEF